MIYQQIDDLTQELDTRADEYHPNPFKFPPATASSNKATTYFPLSFSRSYEKLCKYRISARSLYLASSLLLKIFVLAFAFILLMTGFSFFFQWILGLNSKDLMIELKTITSREKWLVTEFEKFQRNYLRVYSSHEERTKRFKAFCLNMNVLEHRLQQEKMLGIKNQTIWGVTDFFDWTEEEMSKLLIPHNYTIKSKTTSMNKISKVQTKRGYIRPKNWDWRDKGVVTHAKNQLNCGSCWAFSVVAMVETIHAIHNGTLIGLSEQQLIDCDSAENGCEGGFRLYALRYIRDKGLLVENAYPYRGNDGKCQLPSGPIDPTQRVFIDNWQSLPSDEEQIADWIATKGPVTFGMNATKSMYHYRGGVFLPSQEECSHESLGSHSMEVVGYGVNDQQIPYWILKNSWGSGYGINGGYLHMRRGVNSCGITREVYSALITR